MSPQRRVLLQLLALLTVLGLAGAVLASVRGEDRPPLVAADQSVEGPVLLVPGYGGSTAALEVLAAALRQAGRTASVVPLPGDGTGDLALSVAALEAAVAASGPLPVDLVGYSAGGVVARLWTKEQPSQVRRVVTLGSPHHGTDVAALGVALLPGACPVACQQLVPGSPLLDDLNDGDETPDGPEWLSLWTTQDRTVTPPTSARLDGAVELELQQLCPGLVVSHSDLPRDATVTRVVLGALSGPGIAEPTMAVCG